MPARKQFATKHSAAKQSPLTTPDLVLLSLLAERPMHGYQANLELERRQVKDWAGISRPQVYYSLDKLARAGFIRPTPRGPAPSKLLRRASPRTTLIPPTLAPHTQFAAGPERNTFATTALGRSALSAALDRETWTSQRDRPPFLTWLALSWQASSGAFQRQLRRRRNFLQRELSREHATLLAVRKEVGHSNHEAVWMLLLVIAQFNVELRWLRTLDRSSRHRAPALHPHQTL